MSLWKKTFCLVIAFALFGSCIGPRRSFATPATARFRVFATVVDSCRVRAGAGDYVTAPAVSVQTSRGLVHRVKVTRAETGDGRTVTVTVEY